MIASYQPHAKEAAFHASAAKYRLLLGAWGSGKTTALIWEDLAMAFEVPGSLGVVYRATFPALRDTTKRDYLGTVPPELIAKEVKSEGREELEFINGSRTLFRCLDDFRKLGSTQFDRIAVDEAWEIDEMSFMTLAFGRLRGQRGPRRMVLATNPPDEDHFLHKFFVDAASTDTDCFHLSTYDNAAHLPEGYIARLETMPPAWRRKYLDGKWGICSDKPGVFAADFNEDLHVQDVSPLPARPIFRGWDPGFRRPCCVWVQGDLAGNVNVLHEMLGENEPIRQFARRVLDETKKEFPGARVEDYIDRAANQRSDRGPTICQILANEFGLNPSMRVLSIARGIEGIRQLLRTQKLRLRPRCRWGIKGFAGGYGMDTRAGHTDEPYKDGTYDNWFDAFRYAVMPTLLPAASAYTGQPLPRRTTPWWDGDPLPSRAARH